MTTAKRNQMARESRTNRKAELYAAAARHGQTASFVANVVMCWHRNPTRKLAGLVKLLDRGHDVRTAQFSLDILMIDGQQAEWTTLETVK